MRRVATRSNRRPKQRSQEWTFVRKVHRPARATLTSVLSRIVLALLFLVPPAWSKRLGCPFGEIVPERLAQNSGEIDAHILAAAKAVRLNPEVRQLNLSRPGAKGKSLPASFAGLCGFASASVLHQLHQAGIAGVAHQTQTLFGGGVNHTIVFVPLLDPATGKPSTKRGLWVDLTMKQFNDRWVSGGRRTEPGDFTIVTEMVKNPEARKLLTSIFRDGYVEVDDNSLQVLSQAFRLDHRTGKMPPKDPSLRVEKLLEGTSQKLYSPRPDPDFDFEFSATDFP